MIVLVAAVVLAVGFAVIFLALASRRGAEAPTTQWLDEFSVESYAPMERLLSQADIAFLASQAGYRPEIGRRLMRERRRIFKSYLTNLAQDFNQLIALGKLMLVYSHEDRPEFARNLLHQQVRFYCTLCALRLQLALHPVGLGRVDVRSLVASVEAMHIQIEQLALHRASSQLA
ncbi:MAG TPA: hypothetical protein VMH80_09120 [Bryobacteraceae bacterium]|nr:hypothetical protein [Bryobacteraceae bacterium]